MTIPSVVLFINGSCREQLLIPISQCMFFLLMKHTSLVKMSSIATIHTCRLIRTHIVWELQLCNNILPSVCELGSLVTVCWNPTYCHPVWMAQTTSHFFRLFLGLMNEVPADIFRWMWFQHDCASANFTNYVHSYLDNIWSPMNWSWWTGLLTIKVSGFISIDFFIRGAMKNMVYETPVASAMDLVARISVATANIWEMLGIFQKVRLSVLHLLGSCILANDQNFEHLL